MNKNLGIFGILLAMVFSFSACGEQGSVATTTTALTTTATVETTTAVTTTMATTTTKAPTTTTKTVATTAAATTTTETVVGLSFTAVVQEVGDNLVYANVEDVLNSYFKKGDRVRIAFRNPHHPTVTDFKAGMLIRVVFAGAKKSSPHLITSLHAIYLLDEAYEIPATTESKTETTTKRTYKTIPSTPTTTTTTSKITTASSTTTIAPATITTTTKKDGIKKSSNSLYATTTERDPNVPTTTTAPTRKPVRPSGSPGEMEFRTDVLLQLDKDVYEDGERITVTIKNTTEETLEFGRLIYWTAQKETGEWNSGWSSTTAKLTSYVLAPGETCTGSFRASKHWSGDVTHALVLDVNDGWMRSETFSIYPSSETTSSSSKQTMRK